MKISRLPAKYNKDIKPLLSGICNEAKSLLEQRKINNDRMKLIRDNYTSKINNKTILHQSIRNDNTTIVDNYFTNLTNTYFIPNTNNTFAYIRAKDITGIPDLKYKKSINFIELIYKNYNLRTTEQKALSATYYRTNILNDLTYQFELLDFYPLTTYLSGYGSTFYTLSLEVYKQINSISKYTYMLSSYNNNIIPTTSQVRENMPYYNSLRTDYPITLDLDIKNKLNKKRNELNGLINKLRYEKSYSYKEILTIKKLKSAEFTSFKEEEVLRYNTLLLDYIGTVYMTLLNMQYLMTWLDYQLYPNNTTVWRIDVVAKAENYITNVYPPPSGDTLRKGDYSENFNNKANFSLIFNM